MPYALTHAHTVTLPGGRMLAYSEFGDPRGQVVLNFHGWIGSRVQGVRFDAAAREAGVRVVTPDRPGVGLSEAQPGRSLRDWVRDIEALTGRIGAERFAVFGSSGGSPYALACGRWLAGRVTAVGVSGVLPPHEVSDAGAGPAVQRRRRLAQVAARRPLALWPPLWLAAKGLRVAPDLVLDRTAQGFPPVDRELVTSAAYRATAITDLREATAPGVAGIAEDLRVVLDDWGFVLSEVDTPVLVWHGAQDPVVPEVAARRVAAALPHAELRVLPDQGHYVHVARADEVLRSLLEVAGVTSRYRSG